MNRPFIVPVFLPQTGCPHQCAFCNQRVITGENNPKPSLENISNQIKRFLSYRSPSRTWSQISFYGGNFLGLPLNYMQQLLELAQDFVDKGKVQSLRFSTRPDTITKPRLNILKKYSVETIELGVQSMNDYVLSCSKRGHSSEDTVQAVSLLKKYNYNIGLQLMIGLPGENQSSHLETGRKIAELKPDFVRIYPAIVLKGSILAKWYKEGKYTPLSLDSAVTQAKELYLIFNKNNIPVIRMGLQPSESLDQNSILAGPFHPSFGHLIYSEIFLDKAGSILSKKACYSAVLRVHPRSISKMLGLNKMNIKKLEQKFNLKSIQVIGDSRLSEDNVEVSDECSILC
ncbi:Radical SAM core domain-containing protein [Candidatus Magnetomoraceae bacterium gMMP-15]